MRHIHPHFLHGLFMEFASSWSSPLHGVRLFMEFAKTIHSHHHFSFALTGEVAGSAKKHQSAPFTVATQLATLCDTTSLTFQPHTTFIWGGKGPAPASSPPVPSARERGEGEGKGIGTPEGGIGEAVARP